MEYSVLSVIQHPDYNADTVDNDIALLRIPTGEEEHNEYRSANLFDGDFDGTRNGRKISHNRGSRGKNVRRGKKSSNSKFSSACLPEQGEVLPEYDAAHCMIVGWGKEKNSHVYGTEVLHEAEVGFLNLLKEYLGPRSNSLLASFDDSCSLLKIVKLGSFLRKLCGSTFLEQLTIQHL